MTLTVYPPGTNTGQRRLLHLRYALSTWFGWAVMLFGGLVAASSASAVGVSEIHAVFLMTVLLAGAWLYLMWSTRRLARCARRVRIRGRRTRLTGKRVEVTVTGDQRTFTELAGLLNTLDMRTDLDPVTYEVEWNHAYELAGRSAPGHKSIENDD